VNSLTGSMASASGASMSLVHRFRIRPGPQSNGVTVKAILPLPTSYPPGADHPPAHDDRRQDIAALGSYRALMPRRDSVQTVLGDDVLAAGALPG
jgi:hypothetical protein